MLGTPMPCCCRPDLADVNVVFGGAWSTLDEEAQVSQLLELQRHYETIKDEEVALATGSSCTFGAYFAKARLFRPGSERRGGGSGGGGGGGGSGGRVSRQVPPSESPSVSPSHWLRVVDLLDPAVELHGSFFPERLPHPSLHVERVLQWLRRCGMAEALTRTAFLAAAQKVHGAASSAQAERRSVSAEAREMAKQVTTALFAGYHQLSDDAQQPNQPPHDEFLRDLGQLRIATPYAMPPRTFYESVGAAEQLKLAPSVAELVTLCRAAGGPIEMLVPFAGNIIPQETSHAHLLNAACWSQAMVLHVPNARQLPLPLITGLGAYPIAMLEHIFQHTIGICSLPEVTLRTWQRDGRDAWLDGRSRVGRSGSFKQQLELGCYPYLATAEPALLAGLLDAPIVLLESVYTERLVFVPPSRVFVDLSYSAAPYAYTPRDVEFAFTRVKLHALFDCPRTPSLQQVHGWLREMTETAGNAPLDPVKLRSSIVLADLAGLKLLYDTSTEAASASFPIPDRSGRLRNASNLLVDDAPWLDGRVDKSADGHLPVVHSGISATTALRLGARALSAAVQELPDGDLMPVRAEAIDSMLYPGARDAVESQLASWNRNLRSRAFRVSLRRAINYTHRSTNRYGGALAATAWAGASGRAGSAANNNQQAAVASSLGRLDDLRQGGVVAVGEIRSRFLVEQADGRAIDVTLRPSSRGGGQADGSYGSDALTVVDETSGAPTIYLKLGRPSGGGGVGGGVGGGGVAAQAAQPAPPVVHRQASGYRIMQKLVKRWKPCLATELDRYLGEGSVRDRMLLVELLDTDDTREMPDVLNLYRIPMQSFDPSLGTRYQSSLGEGKPRQLGGGEAELRSLAGQRVLFPSALLPAELREEGDSAPDVLLIGRLERLRPSGEAVVAVTGDDETCLIDPAALKRPPTHEETISDARAQAESEEERRREERRQRGATAEEEVDEEETGQDRPTLGVPRREAGQAASGPSQTASTTLPSEKWPPSNGTAADPSPPPPADEEDDPELAAAIAASLASAQANNSAGEGGAPSVTSAPSAQTTGDNEEVRRVEYRPAQGWEDSELAARAALAARLEARRKAAPAQREPLGMDRILRRSEAIGFKENSAGVDVPFSKNVAEGTSVVAAIKRTPGYDLVRVGNFTERGADSPPDIAFFHSRLALHEIYDEKGSPRIAHRTLHPVLAPPLQYVRLLDPPRADSLPCARLVRAFARSLNRQASTGSSLSRNAAARCATFATESSRLTPRK